jgi:RNA recognition motif-containing protein
MAETNRVGERKRILVKNIGHSAQKDINAWFARFGPITETKMIFDRLTRRQTGFVFVTLTTAKNAATAISTLNGVSYKGRSLQLIPARAKWPRPKPMAKNKTVVEPGRSLVKKIGNSTKNDIKALIAKFGPLTETKIPIDRLTKRQTGYVFVTFMTAKHAGTTISTLNGTDFQVRTLRLTRNTRKAPWVGSQRDATTKGTPRRGVQNQGNTKADPSMIKSN